MTTPDRAADRRRIAEAMGGIVVPWTHKITGTWYELELDGMDLGQQPTEADAWATFDPWADDAAAWRLQRWLAENTGEVVSIGQNKCGDGKWLAQKETGVVCWGYDTPNAALCAAALAWIEAKDAKESENG